MKRRGFLGAVVAGIAAACGLRLAMAQPKRFRLFEVNPACNLPSGIEAGSLAAMDDNGGFIVPPEFARQIAEMKESFVFSREEKISFAESLTLDQVAQARGIGIRH